MKARENPFRRDRLESLPYRAPDFDWDTLEARLDQLGGRGALVGPKGHGKTTLLSQWAARHPDTLAIRIREGQRRLDGSQQRQVQAGAAGWIFVDSAEQLSWLGWWELQRWIPTNHRLVITAHRAGRLPTLFRCETSPALLGELIAELADTKIPTQPLWQRHRGNIREALRELYDAAAVHTTKPLPKSAISA